MEFLATLINRGVSQIDAAAAAVNGPAGHGAHGPGGPVAGPKYSPDGYCGRRLAGLETGPIPNRGPETSAGLWILVSFSTAFLAARLYLKLYRLKGLWWDDYILVLASGCVSLPFCPPTTDSHFFPSWLTTTRQLTHTLSAILAQVSISLFGLGHYPCDIPNPTVSIPRLTLVGDHFGAMFSMFAVALSKTSWAVTLLRLFHRGSSSSPSSTSSPGRPGHRNQRSYAVWIVWFVIITICLVKGAQGVLVWIPKCGSPAAMGKDVCVMIKPLNGFATFAGSMSGTYDILLAVVPWKTMWGTGLGKREKLGVATTMSVGAVSGVTAFVLAVKMRGITCENFIYDSGEIIVWSTAERSTTIMAACIPVHRAFCRQLRKKLLAQYRVHSSKQHSTPWTGKNGAAGSTTLTGGSTTLTSGNFRSVLDYVSQHGRKGSDGMDEPGCLSLPSGEGGCHAPTDDNASDRAILPVHDIGIRHRSGSEVATSRNNGKILMTQEVKVEYHHHDDTENGRDVLDEREQTQQHLYELKDMGRRGDP